VRLNSNYGGYCVARHASFLAIITSCLLVAHTIFFIKCPGKQIPSRRGYLFLAQGSESHMQVFACFAFLEKCFSDETCVLVICDEKIVIFVRMCYFSFDLLINMLMIRLHILLGL